MPKDSSAYSNRAKANYYLGKFEDSHRDIVKSIALDSSGNNNCLAAFVCLGDRKWNSSIEKVRQFLQLSKSPSKNSEIYAMSLIPWYAYKQLGQDQKADIALKNGLAGAQHWPHLLLIEAFKHVYYFKTSLESQIDWFSLFSCLEKPWNLKKSENFSRSRCFDRTK